MRELADAIRSEIGIARMEGYERIAYSLRRRCDRQLSDSETAVRPGALSQNPRRTGCDPRPRSDSAARRADARLFGRPDRCGRKYLRHAHEQASHLIPDGDLGDDP